MGLSVKRLLITALSGFSIYAHADNWSSFHINSDACRHLYAYINGSWVEQPTTYMTSKTSNNYYCEYNNAPIRITAADWHVSYYFGALGSILRANFYYITDTGIYYGIGSWPAYSYDYWNLMDAWNINAGKNSGLPRSTDGFHLLIDQDLQDGSYVLSYNKNAAEINLRASTYMLGNSYIDAPGIYLQVLGSGNSENDNNKNLKPQNPVPTENNGTPITNNGSGRFFW